VTNDAFLKLLGVQSLLKDWNQASVEDPMYQSQGECACLMAEQARSELDFKKM